jgi:hypothetical protein
MARREDWGDALPTTVAVLTAGVDVQGDRIEMQILGWGGDEEAWVIDYCVLWGDPSGPRLTWSAPRTGSLAGERTRSRDDGVLAQQRDDHLLAHLSRLCAVALGSD